MTYKEFLESKIELATESGFVVDPEKVNKVLKPHQRDAVVWALKGGRRALFESFGLGKTVQEIEFCHLASEHSGGRALIVLPLGVKQEFTHDAVEVLGYEKPEYCRTMEEVEQSTSQIVLTNYERVRDGDIRPDYFAATSLDEASVLRSFGSKTYQTFLDKFKNVPYKLVATATPSPNKYKELIHYAGYLEVMDTGQALTRFFQRDSTKANNLTLYPNMEDEFWMWVSSWALFITKPSDLNPVYSDEGYDLPPLDVRWHELPVHYGAPTMRKRFFMIARCDGKPIVFPEPTHGPSDSEAVKEGLVKPYVGAYTQLDFSLPCPSIFDTSEEIKKKYGIRAVRPLAPKTMERIARGLKKFVLDNPEPFIIQCNHGGERRPNDIRKPMPTITGKHGYGIVEPTFAPYMGTNTTNHPGGNCKDPIHTITTGNQQCLISPTLIQYHSETAQGEVRGQTIEDPIMTVDGSNRYGLVTSFLSKFYKSGIGQDEREPLHTITTSAGHFGEVRAFLIKYYGQGTGQDIKEPLDTVTSRDRFGLVTINGTDYQIVDIGLRMLEPRELYGCQGFPDDYIIDHDYTGKTYPRSEQVRRCGNAVCPPIPAALVRANLPELCVAERTPNMKIKAEQTGQLRFA